METIRIALDKELLQAVGRAARQLGQNRSAFVRQALRERLARLEVQTPEERDRQGYLRQPQSLDELGIWGTEAAWPVP